MGLYDNVLAAEREKAALKAANIIEPGRGAVFLAAQGAERMNQGARQLFGIEEPAVIAAKAEEAKQTKLNSILSKYQTMDTAEQYQAAATELFTNGFPEYASKVQAMMANLPKEEKDREPTNKESTMEMAAEMHQCAIDAGGWKKSDMACKAQVRKTYVELNRGTADEAGMIAGAKANAEAVQKQQTQIYLNSNNSQDSLVSINQSINMLDDIYSGTAGEGISGFKRFLVGMGFADSTVNASEEGFLRNSMKSVTDWIQLTKGSISDKEMEAFIAASPSLQNTKAGNLLILTTMKNMAQYSIDVKTEWNRWKTQADITARASGIPVSEVEWETHVAKWYDESGKRPKAPTAAEIQAAIDNNVVDDSNKEDFDTEYSYTVR